MGYASLREAVDDLGRTGQLRRIDTPVDPRLEVSEIHRRVFAAGGPALYFPNVQGCRFPVVCNIFGTMDRARFLFRDALPGVRALVRAKTSPGYFLKAPRDGISLVRSALTLLPRPSFRAPVLAHECAISDLPQIVSWPDDGGPFITLPQVYSEDPARPGLRCSNLGMYRVQLGGNDYVQNAEIGLHYQLHRGIGVHHSHAIARGERLPVRIFVGGPPAMTVAAVMPLPEGLPELSFAGALNGRAMRMVKTTAGPGRHVHVHADADFCIHGWVGPRETKPEGPFGDHLGYYAKTHPFPVLHVERVTHRESAIWPFTTVGRPPQEDTIFGELIHDMTGPLVPDVLPGVRHVHAVDASGVHPLLLAIGSERYRPYAENSRPMELLTQAHGILGQGQMSLAKYLFIINGSDAPDLDIHDIRAFFMHLLERIDFSRDLHFTTKTSIDTLDYSGEGFNEGSKLVIAAIGAKRRSLATGDVSHLRLPVGFRGAVSPVPGVLVVSAPPYGKGRGQQDESADAFAQQVGSIEGFPLMVLSDDSRFAGANLNNFLWTTFTRSNPAADIYGFGSETHYKHWSCKGPLVIDARRKPQHAPPLVEDPQTTARVDAWFARGGPLHGLEK